VKRSFLCLMVLMSASGANAQRPATPPSDAVTNVEVDPIRCWWRTSSGSVRIGEHFELWLTCATLENEAVQVVPDQSHLGVEVAAMAPFEVVGGTHPADLRSGQRRFFQYQYILRIINPDAIGKDVRIPDTVIHYKVNSRVAANTSLQGRDLTYILPSEDIRIASMVPAGATDIRDAAGESFAIVESLGLRAGVLEIVAITCVALGSLMVLFVLVRLAGRARRRTPVDERRLTTGSVVSAAIRDLNAVQRDREQQGWSSALAGRALAATRIAAASALGRPVSQRIATPGAADGTGRILSRRPWRGKAFALSSPVTSDDLAKHAPADPRLQPAVDDLRAALTTFSLSQYGRDAALDESALDTALSNAIAAAKRVKAEHAWYKTAFQRLVSSSTPAESRA
jgi:hypothetical protein